MGATESSVKEGEDVAAEELTATASDAPEDAAVDDKFLQKNGQISILNVKPKDLGDEINGQFEERALVDVSSVLINLKKDGTETIKDPQDMESLQPNTKDVCGESVNEDVTLNEETQVKDINEVGLKKIFKFPGFKFNLKKDTIEKSEVNDQEVTEHNEVIIDATEDTCDAQNDSNESEIKNTSDETQESEVSVQLEPSQQRGNETEPDHGIKMVEDSEATPVKEMEKVLFVEPEETMSPIKQFFSQGIFASLKKKKKDEESQKDYKEDEHKVTEKMDVEETEKEDSVCMCLEISHILTEEKKDSLDKLELPEAELQNSLEKEKVQESPLKKLFSKFSSRRQRESKTPEKLIESVEQVSEQLKPSPQVVEQGMEEEPTVGAQKAEVLVTNVNLQERKKSDPTVSWEALICGGSTKKRPSKTNENETPDNEKEHEKPDSPLGSSVEADYDQLTSSNEQSGRLAEVETESTWETFKRMVTPKRKVRTGESSTPEQMPSDSEITKDESFSIKKILSGHKKRKSDAKQEQTTSEETAKDQETVDEEDETPAIIPLSEFEVIEPEQLKDIDEQRVEITIEHVIPETSLEDDTFKFVATVSSKPSPATIHSVSEDFEELTDFLSKHQQLSDIPEEGIIEESIETPISSAEWTTQGDTLAEDIVELTADAVTAPEPESEESFGDDTTEMVSALSQLTESPKTSGHVTPVLKEHGVQTSDTLLHETVQSIYITPSLLSVTTDDESQTSLAVSVSPLVIQSSTPEDTNILVAYKTTTATALCTGLLSEEIEPVEEYHPTPILEGIPEVTDAVQTEMVSDNFTAEFEVAELWTDEVHEAEITDLKIHHQKKGVRKEAAAVESERDKELDMPLLEEPGVGESEVDMIETIQNESALDQVIPDYKNSPEMECQFHLSNEIVNEQSAAEPELELNLQDEELSATEFEQANLTKNTSSPTEEMVPTLECLETNVTSVIPDLGCVSGATLKMEGSLHELQSELSDLCEVEVHVIDKVLSESDSAISKEDTSAKIDGNGDGKIAQWEIEKICLIEEADEDDILESQKQSAVDQELSLNETLHTDHLTEEPKMADKKITEIIVDDKVEVQAWEMKDKQQSSDTESDAIHILAVNTCRSVEPPCSKDYAEAGDGEMIQEIKEHIDTPANSKDGFDHSDMSMDPEAHCKIILAPLLSTLGEAEAIATDNLASQADQDTKSSDPSDPNELPLTNENIRSGKVLEMVAFIENTTKQSEQVPQITTISGLQKAIDEDNDSTETTREETGNDKIPSFAAIEKVEILVLDNKDAMPAAPTLEPDSFDHGAIVNKAVADMGESNTTTQIDTSNEKELNIELSEEMRQTNEPLEQLVKESKEKESQLTEHESPLSSEFTVQMIEAQGSEPRAVIPITDPQVKMSVVTDGEVDTATVTEVERPVVTAVVVELEVETPIKTSVSKPADAQISAVESETQNIDVVTTGITEEIVAQPNVFVVVPQSPDQVNGNIPTVLEDIEETHSILGIVKTQVIESVTVVSPEVEKMSLNSAIVLEQATPVLEEAAVVGNIAETTDSLEKLTPSNVAEIPALVEKPVVCPEIEITLETIPKLRSETIELTIPTMLEGQHFSVEEILQPNDITEVVMPLADTTLITEIETPIVSVTPIKPTVVAVTQTVVADTLANVPVTVTETACPVVVTPPVAPETLAVKVVQDSVVPTAAVSETSLVTPVVETPSPISVTVIETPVTACAEASALIPVLETPVSNAVVETSIITPVLQSSCQTLVTVNEAENPTTVSAEETFSMFPVLENTTQVAVFETPFVTPVEQNLGQSSVKEIENSPPEIVAEMENRAVIQVVEMPVKTTEAAHISATVVTPVVDAPEQSTLRATEPSPQVVETTANIQHLEEPVVETKPVEVLDEPKVTPVFQTLKQDSMRVTEMVPQAVFSEVTLAADISTVIPVVQITQIEVVDGSVLTPAAQSPCAEPSPPPVNSGVETPALVSGLENTISKEPVLSPVLQIPGQTSVRLEDTSPLPDVLSMPAAVEIDSNISVEETSLVKTTRVAEFEAPVVTPVAPTLTQTLDEEKEVLSPTVETALTAPSEIQARIPVIDSFDVKTTQVSALEAPVVSPVVHTSIQSSVRGTELSLPTVCSQESATVETTTCSQTVLPGLNVATETTTMTPVIETSVVKTTQVAVLEAPPVEQTFSKPSDRTETSLAPSLHVARAETPTVIETPVVKTSQVGVVKGPVVSPLVQTLCQTTVKVESPATTPVVETTILQTTQVAVFEAPLVTPVEQTPGQNFIPNTPAAVDTNALIPVVEMPLVQTTQIEVFEAPAVTLVEQINSQFSVGETSPTTVFSDENVAVETNALIPVVKVPFVQTTQIEVFEAPAVTQVEQTTGQSSVRETSLPAVVSGDVAVKSNTLIPVVEMPLVLTNQVAVLEAPVVTPIDQKTYQFLPPAVDLGENATVETYAITPVEMPLEQSTQVAVLEATAMTPIVQMSGHPSTIVKETEVPEAIPDATTVETPNINPKVEFHAAISPPVAVFEKTVVKTPEQASVTVKEPSHTVIISAVKEAAETPVITTVVETPVIKPAPVFETPVVPTPNQVVVTVKETSTPVPVAEAPVVTSAMRSVAPILERSVVSLVVETTAPATIAVTERPILIPAVQTQALVSVFLKEAASLVGSQPVTTATETVKCQETQSPMAQPKAVAIETPMPVLDIPTFATVVQTAPKDHTNPVGSTVETHATISLEKAQPQAQIAETPAQAPVMLKLAMARTAEAPDTATLLETPEVKKANLQVVAPTESSAATTESLVVFEDALPSPGSTKEMKTSSSADSFPHESSCPSTEPQSELEEDVWEDAVDDICDSQTQESTPKHASDVLI